jgi:glutamyl-tRNA reductase
MMEIYAIGTSHRRAPVDFRERVAISDAELEGALASLRGELAAEAAIVSTCNRTEIYVVPSSDSFHADELRAWLGRWKGLDLPSDYFFSLYACGASKHLMEVASGMDSQVLGDIQILGQVKQAFQIARQSGSLGKVLSRLFSSALHTGKRVKTETDLFSGAASISYAAVELSRKIFYPLTGKKALVVGAGDTGELTAVSLHGQGVRNITVANRTEERARELIGRIGFGTFMPLGDIGARLHEFDIVIVSTGAQDYLITYEMARAAASRRSSSEMQLIVDISVPRNVDPRVGTIGGIFCKDLNDLNGVIEANVARRREELPRAEAIIIEELTAFSVWCNLLPVTPVVARLQQRSEQILRAELERNRGRFSESDFRNVEKLVASVVKKIIGMPMAHLLNSEADIHETMQKAEYVSLLFNLHLDETAADESVEDDNPPVLPSTERPAHASIPVAAAGGTTANGTLRKEVRENA